MRILLFLALWVFQITHSSIATEKPAQAVRFDAGKLSVNFKEIPITSALGQIAHRAEIDFFVDRTLREKITIHFQGLTLEEGLRRVLKSFNHAMILREDQNGVHSSGVKVYRQGQLALGTYDVIRGHSKQSLIDLSAPLMPNNFTTNPRGTNPRAVGAHGQIAQAISETYRNLSLLKRKAAGEEKGLRKEIAKLRTTSAQEGLDPASTIKRVKVLEQQLARVGSMGGQMIRNEVNNIQQLRKQMVMVQSPEKMQYQAVQRQQRAERERAMKRSRAHDVRNQSVQ